MQDLTKEIEELTIQIIEKTNKLENSIKFTKDDWPKAIENAKLGITEKDEIERCENLIDSFDMNVEGKKILYLNRYRYNKMSKYLLYRKAKKVDTDLIENEIYDIVILDKFLDEDKFHIEMMESVVNQCDKNTILYIHCHPWTSRHGGMSKFGDMTNKAYIHLIMNEKEAKEKGIYYNLNKFENPKEYYKLLFNMNNLDIISSTEIKRNLENYFNKNKEFLKIKSKILKANSFENILEIEFINFSLKLR